jgi:biotin-(acetyl-CoA carboxylase) ligase
MLGEAVAFQRAGALVRGIAEDVLADGALRVRLEDGSHLSIVAGEVERVRTVQS